MVQRARKSDVIEALRRAGFKRTDSPDFGTWFKGTCPFDQQPKAQYCPDQDYYVCSRCERRERIPIICGTATLPRLFRKLELRDQRIAVPVGNSLAALARLWDGAVSDQELIDELLGILRLTQANLSATRDQLSACCPLPDHPDTHPSFSINLKTGLWRCFACGRQGNIRQLMAALEGGKAV